MSSAAQPPAPDRPPIIEARGLTKRYRRRRRPALDRLDLVVPAGRVLGLVGPNGAGKSTLLHLACGLSGPSDGTLRVLGHPPGHDASHLARVGFVAQDAPLYRSLTVAEHLRLGAELNPPWDADLARSRIDEVGLRATAAIGAAALVLLAAYALRLGSTLRGERARILERCRPAATCDQLLGQFQASHQNTLLFQAAGLGLTLALVATFWGAPLVARELEAGTHRLVWNQSITRRRWWFTEVAVATAGAVVAAGVASALLTWAAVPVDDLAGNRFGTVLFGARNLAPLGPAVLAVGLGAVIGLLARRTLPAMALTFAAFLVLLVVPNLVRPHLLPPERRELTMTAEAINRARSLGSITGAPVVGGIVLDDVPDAYVSHVSPLLTSDGRELDRERFDHCFLDAPATGAGGTFGDTAVCLAALDLHLDVEYHPAGRYWAFQALETGLYLVAAAALIGVGSWRITSL